MNKPVEAATLTGAQAVVEMFLTSDLEPDYPRTDRGHGQTVSFVPTIAPTANGSGMVLGIGGTL